MTTPPHARALLLAAALLGAAAAAAQAAPQLRLSPGQTLATLAGAPAAPGFSGDGGPAAQALLDAPTAVLHDGTGGLYVSDTNNNRVRHISAAGAIATVAGNGQQGFSGDGGAAAAAALNAPTGLALDAAGNLYIADTGNQRIREVAPSGAISTLAGSGAAGYAGDGGPAGAASFDTPTGLALDAAGDLYIADTDNQVVRELTAAGALSTVAGSGQQGFSGDGGAAAAAALNDPSGLALDAAGDLYIADTGNQRIREVAGGVISTVAGGGAAATGNGDGNGDGGPAAQAALDSPAGVAIDAWGNLWIADSGHQSVRRVDAAGNIATLAGSGAESFADDGGPAILASLDTPAGLAADAAGDVYIADQQNHVIRFYAAAALGFGSQSVGAAGTAQSLALANLGAAAVSLAPPAVTGADAADFAVATTCGAALAAGASCSISVVFTPSAAGARTALLNGGDAAGASPQTAALSGTGAAAAAQAISFSAPAAETYGAPPIALQAAASSGLAVSFRLVSGPATLANGLLTLTGAGAVAIQADQAGSAAFAAAAPVQQTLLVNPAPLLVTPLPATRAYGAPNPPFTASIAGYVNGDTAAAIQGAPAIATTASAASDPGSYPLTATLGTLAAANYVFTFAPGALTVTQAAQTIAFGPIPAVTYSPAPLALAAQASSGLPVAFSLIAGPAMLSGGALTLDGTGTITVEADQAGNLDYLAAPPARQSFAVLAPLVAASAAGLDFGSQPVGSGGAAQTLNLTNRGNAPLLISSVAASGDFSSANTCAAIAPGAGCSLSVTFAPTALGTRTGALAIADNAVGGGQAFALAGVGTAPGASLAPAALSFGSQPVGAASAAQSVSILNTGSADLAIAAASASGDFAVVGGCATVPAGGSCSLGVVFNPTQAGTRTGALAIVDSAGTQTASLSGTGSAPGVALSPASLAFSPTLVGQSSFFQSVSLANTGSAPLAIGGIAVAGDFSQTNNCPAALAAGAACSLSVVYAPTLAGAESGALTVNDGLGAQIVALSGAGLAPGMTLSANQLWFGGAPVGSGANGAAAQTVQLSNTGSAPLAVTAVTAPAGFGVNSNCVGALAAGAACAINIGFAPTVAGAQAGVVAIAAAGAQASIAVAGTGVNPGLSIIPSAAQFGGQAVGAAGAAQTLTIANTSAAALQLNPAAMSGDFAESDNCPATLPAGGVCQASVAFAPTALGARTGSLTASDATGLATAVAALGGQGTQLGIAALPAALAFGSQPVGAASPAQTVTVSNSGSAPLAIGAVAVVNNDFTQSNTCPLSPATLAAGQSCVVSVALTPSTAGTRTGALEIADSADGVHTVALSGVGAGAGVSLAPASLWFGSQPIPDASGLSSLVGSPQTVTLSNTGNAPLAIAAIAVQGDFTESNTCGTALAAGSSCTLSVLFAPTGLGQRTGSLTIAGNGAGGGSQSVALVGDGSPTGLALAPAVLNFGAQTVGQPSPPLAAQLTNTTGSAIQNLQISASGEYSETNTCGGGLAAGGQCALSITLLPLAPGAVTGSIAISGTLSGGTSSGGTAAGVAARGASAAAAAAGSGPSLAVVAMLGNAATPGIQLSAPSLTFAPQPVGVATAPQTLTVTNAGAAPLTGVVLGTSADFTLTTTCGTALGAGAACAALVSFRPSAAGARTGALTFAAAGGVAAQVALAGTATGASLTVTPASLTFAARPVATTSAVQTVTLQNTGVGALTLQGYTLSGDFALSQSSCGAVPATLAAGAACALGVSFTPSAAGARAGSLAIASDAAAGTATVALGGVGSTLGLTLSATQITFAPQGVGSAAPAQTLTLANQNAAAIGIAGMQIAGANPADFSAGDECGTSLAAGAQCAVTLGFTPAAVGARAASLAISDDAGVQTIALTGAGSDFSITATGATLTLADLSSDAQTITLACADAEAGSTCSIQPTSVSITAQQTGTAVVAITQPSGAAGRWPTRLLPRGGPGGTPLAWLALCLGFAWLVLAWPALPRRRVALTGAAAGCLLLASLGCGGGGSAAPSANTTPPPTAFTVTITATSSSGATHTVVLNN